MTDAKKTTRKRKPKGPLPDELVDRLLAEVQGKDAESLSCESGLVGQLKSSWPNACCRRSSRTI